MALLYWRHFHLSPLSPTISLLPCTFKRLISQIAIQRLRFSERRRRVINPRLTELKEDEDENYLEAPFANPKERAWNALSHRALGDSDFPLGVDVVLSKRDKEDKYNARLVLNSTGMLMCGWCRRVCTH